MKKYEIVVNSLTDDMKKGILKKGDKLASIRVLAKKYSCNKDTIIKALYILSKEQLVYAVQKSGYYVLNDISENTKTTDFKSKLPDVAQVPFGDFSICLNDVLNNRDMYLFASKPNERGLDDLINSLYSLLPTYSVYTDKTQLFLANGAQQALYILSQMDFNVSKNSHLKNTVLIEQPTYNRMNNLISTLNLAYQTIERSLNGIDLKKLERIFAKGNIKFFYTISRLHYPLGIGYTEQEKMKIVELANKYDVYIIEDDYMADFDAGASLPLHYYDVAEKVIYIKSFSSIVFNSLRLALVVLPKQLISPFLKYKNLIDYDTNLLLQKAMSLYIDNGMFFKHRDKLINLYSKKNVQLIKTLNKYSLSEYSVFDTKTIFKIKHKHEISSLKRELLQDYQIDFLEDCYLEKCPYEYIKIDVKNMILEDIEQELPSLLAILAKYIK